MVDPKQARRREGLRRVAATVALARARLRDSGGGKTARLLGALTTVGFAGAIVALRVADGADASLRQPLLTAAHWIPWIVAPPFAFAAARDRRGEDRRDGVMALAAARGVSSAALEAARVLAAMIEITWALGLPMVVLSTLAAALATRPSVALQRLGVGLGALAFAAVAGITLGGVAALAGRFGGRRGRSLLVALIAGPLVISDVSGQRPFSIPGALSAVLNFTVSAWSPGA